MDMLDVNKKLIDTIKKATCANKEELKFLRNNIVGIVNKIGAKNFVMLTAEILKKDFCIEGCDDLRIPLKRIFMIPLEELEEDLSKKKYTLPTGHPILMLSDDHRDNIGKLKALEFSFRKVNEEITVKQSIIINYYKEIDLHIRKEEEVLFPVLEKNSMSEHPDSLRKEHKKFRVALSEIADIFNGSNAKDFSMVTKKSVLFTEGFLPDMCNHIFRETYIFYPAALEFITETGQWEKIKEGFEKI